MTFNLNLVFHRFIFAICAMVFALFTSCKPHVSLSGATIPPEAKTVSVGYFTNNSSLGAPSLSQRFSERIRDLVSDRKSVV